MYKALIIILLGLLLGCEQFNPIEMSATRTSVFPRLEGEWVSIEHSIRTNELEAQVWAHDENNRWRYRFPANDSMEILYDEKESFDIPFHGQRRRLDIRFQSNHYVEAQVVGNYYVCGMNGKHLFHLGDTLTIVETCSGNAQIWFQEKITKLIRK